VQKLIPDRITWKVAAYNATTVSGLPVSKSTAKRYISVIKRLFELEARELKLYNYNRSLSPDHIYLIAGLRALMEVCGTYQSLEAELLDIMNQNKLDLQGLIDEYRNYFSSRVDLWGIPSEARQHYPGGRRGEGRTSFTVNATAEYVA